MRGGCPQTPGPRRSGTEPSRAETGRAESRRSRSGPVPPYDATTPLHYILRPMPPRARRNKKSAVKIANELFTLSEPRLLAINQRYKQVRANGTAFLAERSRENFTSIPLEISRELFILHSCTGGYFFFFASEKTAGFNGETPAELIDPLDVLFTVNGSSGRKEGSGGPRGGSPGEAGSGGGGKKNRRKERNFTFERSVGRPRPVSR